MKLLVNILLVSLLIFGVVHVYRLSAASHPADIDSDPIAVWTVWDQIDVQFATIRADVARELAIGAGLPAWGTLRSWHAMDEYLTIENAIGAGRNGLKWSDGDLALHVEAEQYKYARAQPARPVDPGVWPLLASASSMPR